MDPRLGRLQLFLQSLCSKHYNGSKCWKTKTSLSGWGKEGWVKEEAGSEAAPKSEAIGKVITTGRGDVQLVIPNTGVKSRILKSMNIA